mgnify:CR=1 FL=1
MVQIVKTQFTLNRDTPWDELEKQFKSIATSFGYPNLSLSSTDLYQGLIDVYNMRTRENIWQLCWDAKIEFTPEGIVFNVDGAPENRMVYREPISSILTTTSNYKTVQELEEEVERLKEENAKLRFANDTPYKPYDKLHRPAVGSTVVWGDDHFMIVGVEGIHGSDLLTIYAGPHEFRSDDFLKYCRYTNGNVCGWQNEEEFENPACPCG